MKVSARRIGKGKVRDWAKRAKAELKSAQKDQAIDLIQAHEEVVEDWDHQPKFEAKVRRFTISIKARGPNAKIWDYVNWGTRPHKIRAKNAKALSFVWGGPGSYQPRTKPIGKFGGPGTVSGGERVAFAEVDHPGNKPRLFTVSIRAKAVPKYAKRIGQAVGRIFK